MLDHVSGYFNKPLRFCGRKPRYMQPVFADAGQIQQLLGHEHLFFSLYITFQVMTVAEMSTGYQHPIRSAF